MEERKRLSNEEKLKLMQEYIEVTGNEIKTDTTYKGYKLGNMQNNLRQSYSRGTLKMPENLLKQFEKLGIMKKGKQRKAKTTQQEKYDFLMGIAGYSQDERGKAKMYNGATTREVVHQMQVEYNRGNLRLTEEQIRNLKQNGFLRCSTQEKEELAKKYVIPVKYLIDIIERYGSYEVFIDQYKKGEIDYDFPKEVFCGYRGITLSEQDITERQKLAYSNLMEKIIGNVYEVGTMYIDIDEVNRVIEEVLTDIEKPIIQMRFGLEGKKFSLEECGKRFNVGPERIRQREVKATQKLRRPKRSRTFIGNIKLERANLKKFELEYKNAENCVDALNKIREFIKGLNQETRRNIGDVRLEEIGIIGMTFSPDEPEIKTMQDLLDFIKNEKNAELDRIRDIPLEYTKLSRRISSTLRMHGIYTLRDTTKLSESELRKIRCLGSKAIAEIVSTVESLGLKLHETDSQGMEDSDNGENNTEKKILTILELCDKKSPEYIDRLNELNLEIERLRKKIRRYDIAYQNYIEKENIFDPNAIVPATPKRIQEENSDVSNNQEQMQREALLNSIRANQKELAKIEAILARFGLDNETVERD